MKKNLGPQPFIYPMPVFILGTYDEKGNPDAMNAAWGGTYDTNMVTVSLSKHQTTDNLEAKKCFTVAFGTRKTLVACDYVGIVSAKAEKEKIKKSGLTPVKAPHIDAPMFEEFPLTLECEVVSFVDGTLIGRIVGTVVDDEVLTDGKIDPKKMEAIVYEPVTHKYLLAAEAVGQAFHDGLALK